MKKAIKILITIFLAIGAYYTLSSLGLVPSFEAMKPAAGVAKELAALDNYNHSAEEFLSILNELHENHPNYSRIQTADGIARTWNGFKNVGKDISMYTVATDIKQLSEKYPGADYAKVLVNYMLFGAK